MKKNILLGLVIIISAILYFNPEKHDLPVEVEGGNKQNLFTTSCLENLSRIQFIKDGASQELVFSNSLESKDILIKRSKWLLKQPFLAPANDEKVDEIILGLKALRGDLDQSAPKSSSQGQYGLVPPDGVLILECSGVKEVVSIGTKNELSENRYYQKEGEEALYLVKDKFLESFILSLKDIRAKKILAFDPTSIEGIEVVQGSNFYSLDKTDEGNWIISSDGQKFQGDQKFIEKELVDLVNINISRIFDNPLEILPLTGLEQPLLILNLKIKVDDKEKDKPNTSLILQFGRGLLGDFLNKDLKNLNNNKQPHYLKITKDNSIYELERSYIADWLQGANHFRSRAPLLSIDRSSLTSVSINIGQTSCGLDGQALIKNIPSLELLEKAFNVLTFDVFIESEELNKYKGSEGLKVQFQFGTRIISILKSGDVINNLDNKNEVVASILEVSEVGKENYYGSISSIRMAELEVALKELCIKGKVSESHI